MRHTGRTLKHTVNEMLRLGLAQRTRVQTRARKQKPFKVRANDMGLHPGLNYDCASRLLDEIEGPTHR